MMMFILMVLAAWVFVILAVRTGRSSHARDSMAEAIEIHKARLASLEEQHQKGELDTDDYRQFREETEHALLEDTRKQGRSSQYRPMPLAMAAVALVVVSGSAFALYYQWGAAEGVEVRRNFVELASSEEPSEAQLRETLTGYQAMLERRPEDIEGWFRLANMQMELGQYADAQPSLERVLTLLRDGQRSAEDESTILAYLGQTLWAQEQPRAALERFEEALEYNAQNTLALGFAGRLSYEMGNHQASLNYWTRLKRLAEGGDTRLIDEFITRSRAALDEAGVEYEEPEAATTIDITVALPAAWEGLPDSAALFVYARPIGESMPLAVRRVPVTAGEHRIMLSDADAMGPMGGLSGHDRVEVTARVSFKGQAEPAPGDWTATPVQVDLNAPSDQAVQLDVSQP